MNNEDRKILECAAKAAGFREHGWIGENFYVIKGPNPADDFDPFRFNPLNDTMDAFALMVDMRLNCIFSEELVEVWHSRLPDNASYDVIMKLRLGAASVRRAITLAAARIGGYEE